MRALYFGDTGTPLDRKEARFNLGPLECHGDTLFTHSVTFRRQVCVVFFLDSRTAIRIVRTSVDANLVDI